MKPWGSQVRNYVISNTDPIIVSSGNREDGEQGVEGDGNESPSARYGYRETPARTPTSRPPTRPRDALDYSGFGLRAAGRPSHPDTPRRPFVPAVLGEGRLPGTDKAAS